MIYYEIGYGVLCSSPLLDHNGNLQYPAVPVPENFDAAEMKSVQLWRNNNSDTFSRIPGKHKYVRIPRLYDDSGYGAPWRTWLNVDVLKSSKKLPSWMHYYGRWGNPHSKCHPFAKMGLQICQFTDGPTGIPMKQHDFQCQNSTG